MTVTADSSTSSSSAPRDRRRASRHRLAQIVPAFIGRTAGTLIDLSASGARIRHTQPLVLGTRQRIRYDWESERFEGFGDLLASRVIAVGDGAGTATRYESRFRFVSLSDHAEGVLERTLTILADSDLRQWVANLHGWHDERASQNRSRHDSTFIRCRSLGNQWEQKITLDASAPVDGFTVPADVNASELGILCKTYAESDDGKYMVRLLTRAVVREHMDRA